jgi:hypothetical protein
MFYPMFVMVILTFIVAIYLLASRISAVKQRKVSIGYFRLNSGASEPPPHLIAAAKHYSNLFELPLLFYVTCLVTMVMGFHNALLIILAWVFVASRVIHALIHLTYNNVVHRMLAFLCGATCILIMWLVLAAHVTAR